MNYLVTEEDSFMDALLTPIGTVIGRYDYGTKFSKLKHRSLTSDLLIEAKRSIKDACSFDPRLNFEKATIDTTFLSNGILKFLVWANLGRVMSFEVKV
jgi:phage baseplate assembly protein W